MSFSEPLSLTLSGTTTSLPRTGVGNDTSTYRSADASMSIVASSLYGRRTRRTIRFNHSKITTDPVVPAQNKSVSMSNYIVFDMPDVGYTPAEALAVWKALQAFLAASSDSAVVKLLGGES